MSAHFIQKDACVGTRYKIQESVGQGAFGLTYRAWDRLLNRQIALKECFPVDKCWREGLRVCAEDEAEYKHATAALYDEATTLARLKHPGIVTIHDAFIDAGTNSLFIVMEWLSGGSLDARMKKEPVPHDKAEQWLRTILSALKEVHERSITHRDIKPSNIMFNSRQEPVLVDFGAALNRDTKVGKTIQGPYTARYAAPEQLDAGFGRIGPWTDFYALAATWYEMLTGVAYQINPRLSIDSEKKALVESVMKNLAAEPEKRCQSAEEWLSLLGASLTVDDVYYLIRELRERYPKDKNGRLPVAVEILLRMAEFNVARGKRAKMKVLKDAAAIVSGAAGIGGLVASVGVAMGWGQGLVAALVAFFAGGPVALPIGLGVAGLAGIGLAVRHFVQPAKSEQQVIEETLHGVSERIRNTNLQFWEENKDLWR